MVQESKDKESENDFHLYACISKNLWRDKAGYGSLTIIYQIIWLSDILQQNPANSAAHKSGKMFLAGNLNPQPSC